jgi:hypothetical protein
VGQWLDCGCFVFALQILAFASELSGYLLKMQVHGTTSSPAPLPPLAPESDYVYRDRAQAPVCVFSEFLGYHMIFLVQTGIFLKVKGCIISD